MEMLMFSIAPCVLFALANTSDDRAFYLLQGDLSQMGRMYAALSQAGFPIVKSGVYPGFARDDLEHYKRALRYIFSRRIDGWWNQEEALISHGVCTQAEYDAALGRET